MTSEAAQAPHLPQLQAQLGLTEQQVGAAAWYTTSIAFQRAAAVPLRHKRSLKRT